MYPIRFKPIYQDYIWGGDRISHKYHRADAKGRVAESWEISDRDDGMSVVVNGPYKGRTLHDLMEEMGEELLGYGQSFERFPLLLKIIDAKEHLSIQVHPDRRSAAILDGEPKSESWFVLEPGHVLAGFSRPVDEQELREAIQDNRAEELLQKIDVQKGDVIYIPGGRVHAICAGCLLFEVQQNSNTTYRLYDWGRKGPDGKSRPLHIEESIQVIHWNDPQNPKIQYHHLESDIHHQHLKLITSPFFVIDRLDIFDKHRIASLPKSFQILFCLEGAGELSVDGHQEPFKVGMTYLIPAAAQSIEVVGRCQTLRVYLP